MPLVSGDRVIAVLVAATSARPTSVPAEEIALLETLAAESALALDRTRSATQLEEALERECRWPRSRGKVRSEHDIEAVLRDRGRDWKGPGRHSLLREARRARHRHPDPLEWTHRASRTGPAAPNLPVTNLALTERRTVAIADRPTPELEDPALGGVW